MAQIDVTELLTDPDLVDKLVLIHRQTRVNDHGQNKLNERGEPTVGSVQPVSGKTLQRLPEALRVAGLMSFWIKGKIVADGKCQYPDLISFKGERYAVQVVFDWTAWGAGWSEGTCVRERPS